LFTLGQLAKKYGECTPAGWRLEFRLTHEELGALIGASRVMVSYAMTALRQEQLIAEDHHRLVIAPALLERCGQTPEETFPNACPCFQR